MDKLHPWILMLYFVQVFVCIGCFFHPVYYGISIVAGLCFYHTLYQTTFPWKQVVGCVVVIAMVTGMNLLWNHQGVTILGYLGDNPVTKEALLYGMVNGMMFCSIFLWFACFSKMMTSDKVHYLFGSVLPTFALIFSMVLGLIPKLKEHMEKVRDARRQMGVQSNGKIDHIKDAMKVTSMTMTWALEHSIDTADSMKARGYGVAKRTYFSMYRYDTKDAMITLLLVAMFGGNILSIAMGSQRILYFPMIQEKSLSPWSLMLYGSLCLLPEIMRRWEDRKWKRIESRM